MKVLLGIESSANKLLPISTELASLNHEVQTFISDDFSNHSSHIGNFLDKVSFHSLRTKYNRKKFLELENLIRKFLPDIILFINFPLRIFSVEDFARLSIGNKIRVFLVDPIKKHPAIKDYLKFCDRVFSYDKDEADKWNMQYLPVGYSPSYEMQFDSQIQKPIDVSFIGTLFKNRIKMLEPLAKFMNSRGRSLRVFSPAFKKINFWKRPIFGRKFPNLAHCIENGFVNSDRAAQIYSQSKICLNIHVRYASSPNPRTFEILATGSFELVDEREYYSELTPGKDLATFNSPENLVERVEYFLNHEEERMEIAMNGWKKVVPDFRLSNCLERIFRC